MFAFFTNPVHTKHECKNDVKKLEAFRSILDFTMWKTGGVNTVWNYFCRFIETVYKAKSLNTKLCCMLQNFNQHWLNELQNPFTVCFV